MTPRPRDGQLSMGGGPGDDQRVIPAPPVDRLLARRGTRHNTLGPTGARVFCTRLDNLFGLCGRFAFVHDRSDDEALFDPARLTISVDGTPLEGNRAACMWYPSHSRRQVKEHDLGVVEDKFITWDDVLCDVVSLTNHGAEVLKVRLEVQTAATGELARTGKDTLTGTRVLYGKRVSFVLAMRTTRTAPAEKLICDLRLKPGEQTSLLLAMGVGLRHNEAQNSLSHWAASADPLTEQERQYQRWFDLNCPHFDCPDERLVRLWWYRWFLVRHNLVHPGFGKLPHPLCYPSRAGLRGCVSPATGLPMLRELRWLRDPVLVHSQILSYLQMQTDAGLYQTGWVDGSWPAAPDVELPDLSPGLVAGFGEALCVQPLEALAGAVGDSAARYLAELRKHRDPDNNLLLSDPLAPLESVATTSLYAASLRAAGRLLGLSGKRLDAQWHEGLSDKVCEALVAQTWDDWDHCFYDRGEGGQPRRVRQALALLPLAFGQAPAGAGHAEALAAVVSPEELGSPHPVASVSVHAVRHAPVWLSVNAFVADALASVLRQGQTAPMDRAGLTALLAATASLMWEEGDPARPQSRLFYDAQSGVGEGPLDILVDNLNDLLIRLVGGVTPSVCDELTVHPLTEGWTHFRFDQVPYRGHRLTVIWDTRGEGERYADALPGLTVCLDGQLVAQSPDLEPLTVTLP